MKKHLRATAILLVISLASSHAASVDSNSAAEQQIRAALARWVEATNRGDYKTAFSVWAPDLIGWAPDGSDDSYAAEQKFAKRKNMLIEVLAFDQSCEKRGGDQHLP